MAVRTKPGVRFGGFTPALCVMLSVLVEMDEGKPVGGQPEDLVITAGSDGKHSPNSRHYKFEALDIRSKAFPSPAAKEQFRAAYERRLGGQFRVLLEGFGRSYEHFHVQ